MPINSLDALMFRTSNGFTYSTDWLLTTNIAGAANRWMDMSRIGKYPGTNLYANTNGDLTWVDCNSSSAFSMPSGPTVDAVNGITKHVIYASVMSAVSTALPGFLMLVDLQGYWPSINGTITSQQNLSGTPTLRYANGEGCNLYTVVTTAAAAGTPNISVSYTNQAGTSGRSLGVTPVGTASSTIGQIYPTLVAPFFSLAGGDTGVQNVASITLSASGGGSLRLALCIAKPLLTIPISVISNSTEKDFANQFPSMPEVKNNACLVWLFLPGAAIAANTNIYGSLEYVWG
jgi:hypothetical protein